VNERLIEFRRLAAERSFCLGHADCGTFCADWVWFVRGVDPASAWRGSYSTEDELALILQERGGLVAHFDACLSQVGIERVTSPKPGNVVIVETPQGLTGGVLTGPMVMMAGKHGIVERHVKLTPIVAAWEV
jgi:hypothetical protein